jgi:hypothetical protein
MSTEDILPFCFNPFSFDIDGMGLSEILGKMADSDEWHDGDFVCHCAVCQLLGPMARELERKAEQYDRLVADLYKHTEDSPDEYLADLKSLPGGKPQHLILEESGAPRLFALEETAVS